MKRAHTYFKIFFLFIILFFCSKADAQVNGFTITDGSFPATHNLGTSFPVNVAFNWTSTTTSATVVIAYNNSLVSYNSACQSSLPSCMTVTNNGSAITIAMNNLNSCINTSSISFNVCFQFKCPDSCVGVIKPSVFNGTITDNFGTSQSSTTTANGILPNDVTLSNSFYSFNSLTAEVTFRACVGIPSCFNIKNPVFNVALSPALGTITSAYGTGYTYTVSGSNITPNSAMTGSPCFFYVVKLPCNSGLGQTLTSNITLRGVNCGVANSVIKGPVAASYLIPASSASTLGISLGTGVSGTVFSHTITNTGNTPLNLTTTNYLPLIHAVSEAQSSAQAGLAGTVKYYDCALTPTTTYTITGSATNSNVPANTKKLEHNINNLLPGNSVTLTTNYSAASSCNGAAGTAPYRDSLVITYNCAAPANPCVPCGPGGTRTSLAVYNPSPVMNCLSSNNIAGCKNIGDTISLCYQFRNTGDVALAAGVLEVAFPTWIQYVPGSAVYTGFTPTQPTAIAGTNIHFNLPSIPVSTTNTYSICIKAVLQTGAVGGTNYFYSYISGSNLTRRNLCSAILNVCAYAAIGVNKRVKGSLNSSYSLTGQGAPNTTVDYEVTLRNTGTVPVTNLVVIDRIPAPGNLTILGSPSSAAISNQFTMQMLTAPANANYTVTYTGTQNVCTGWTGTGTPCTTGTWGTALANGAVKFTFTPGFSLAAGATYVFTFQAKIPDGTANNLTDCNTVGFSAVPSGGGTLNPAESAPACITSVNPCNTNVTPGFTVTSSCLNNVYSVTATALETSTTSHEWSLMQTAVCGSTTDANTLNGGNPVAPVQTTTNATFTINTGSVCYYIKHRIFVAGCYDTTIRIPITVPNASNVFNLEDAAGNVKSTFCVGEDIYFDGTASTGESQYSISILRRLAGSSNGYATYANLGTFLGTAGVINLSQALLNMTPARYFDSQYEYSIQFIISNPGNCIGTIANKAAFKVICCRDFISANFQLAVMPATGSYTMTAVLFNTYATANAAHEWYVLSSPNPSGGPYTPVFSTTATTLSYPGAQYNLYYTVIHKVKTSCGEVCRTVVQYQSLSGRSTEASDDCCLAFQYWPNGAGTEPQEFTAEFEIGSTPLGGGQYTINIYPTYSYSSNPQVTHEWYVLSSPNPSGGPFTAVAQSTDFNYNFSPADDALYYFIIHKVKSPCGDVCYGQSMCRNCKSTQRCEMCGVIDCKLLDEIWPKCYPPINLVSDCRRERLLWDAVPAAGGYELELDYNDRNCCRSEYLPSVRIVSLSTNVFGLNEIRNPAFNCIRWRVRAKCDDGFSAWSEWTCYSCDLIIFEPFPLVSRNSGAPDAAKEVSVAPQVFPNPNKGDMSLQMKTNSELVLSVEVFNAQGILVKTIKENKYPDGKFAARLAMGSNIAKGLYLVVFKTNFGTYNKKVIIN